MEDVQNVTLSLPKRLLKRAKVIAAQRETSVSRILSRLLEEFVEREDDYEQARRRAMARMRRGWDLGTGGRATWTRDELHER